MAVVAPAALRGAGTIDRVVAKINEDIVTSSDLDAAVRRSARRGGPGALTPQVFEDVLDRLLLLQAARKQKTEVSDTEVAERVEAALAEARSRYESESDFLADLRRAGLSLEQFKAELTRDYTSDAKLYRAVASRFSVTDADAAAFEEAERQAGRSVGAVQLRRLAAKVEGDDADAKQKARDRVSALLKKINGERLTFAEGVVKYSEMPGAASDAGDLGLLDMGRLSADLRAAVANLQDGQVTEPMVTGEYASIFYVEDKRDARAALFEQRFIAEREKLLQSLRAAARLEVYDDSLRKVIPDAYQRAAGGGSAPTPAPTP